MSKDANYKSAELKKLLDVIPTKSQKILFADQHGTTAVLWSDSHTPLVRHIATCNINTLTRYCINQVYVKGSIGYPPEPTTELAFDIVTPSASRDADAKVIATFSRILQDCPFNPLPVFLQVSHHLLVEAILVYCGVPVDQQSTACHELTRKLGDKETCPDLFNQQN